MRRLPIVFLVAACSHPAKPTTPPPPLVDPKPDTTADKGALDSHGPDTTGPIVPPKSVPAKDPDPIDVPLASGKTTYKLVSPGRGARAVLKIDVKAGAKQALELALDFAGKQVAPKNLGGTQEDVAPTLVLASSLETGESDKDGVKFKVTFDAVDARDRKGAKATREVFKTELGVLAGTVFSGSVAPNGQLANLTLHVDKPTDKTMAALELVRISMMPMWPVLPAEAIGAGAKWQVTSAYTIADRIDATQTTDYEVVSHKGTAWVIKAATKLKGADQTIKDTRFEKIGGTGSFEATLDDGVFLPTTTTKLTTDFTASIAGPADEKGSPEPTMVSFHLDQALTVTPK